MRRSLVWLEDLAALARLLMVSTMDRETLPPIDCWLVFSVAIELALLLHSRGWQQYRISALTDEWVSKHLQKG